MTRAADADAYPPQALREYALLADGERGAIVGPRGDVVWMCAPRWDSGAVFNALIGGHGGYAITPSNRFVWGGYYEPGSLIWHSRWVTSAGMYESREALAMPGDSHRAVLLRRILAKECDAPVVIRLDPCADYGTSALRAIRRDGDVWEARAGELWLRWTGAPDAQLTGPRSSRCFGLELTVPVGAHHDLVLEVSDQRLPDSPPDADAAWRATETAWQDGVPLLERTIAPTDTRHTYAVLRGLTSASGGMVAAATTSLPERAEAGRNYDYRYVWIRDQSYAGQAAAAAGAWPLVDDAVRFTAARLLEHGERLAPAYTTTGGRVPDQRDLDLPGYPGGSDLIGNWVNKQFQLDAFGESLLLFAAAGDDRIDVEAWQAVEVAAAAISNRWTEPDAGIWEIENRPWTHSRLTCAAGLRAIAAIPRARSDAADWLALADRIVAHTASHATHPTGRWQRAPDEPGNDGALLLPGIRGAVPADDPRTVATLQAYTDELTVDGYAYRFRHAEGPLGDAEGSFLLCGFLVALATHQQGRRADAIGWWERTRSACGPAALMSEEYDITERQMRGNLPQAFVHALLLECAAVLGDS